MYWNNRNDSGSVDNCDRIAKDKQRHVYFGLMTQNIITTGEIYFVMSYKSWNNRGFNQALFWFGLIELTIVGYLMLHEFLYI